jgi:hypothetical protein
MTGRSHSTDPAAQDDPLCEWCNVRQRFHSTSALSRHASLQESREAIWNAYRAGQALGTPAAARRDAGSSSTTTGSTRFRGTSGTASSSLVCRRLRRTRSVAIWTAVKSQRGMESGKTSASLKPSNEAVLTTGTAGLTGANCDRGWRGMHLWGFEVGIEDDVFCINCGRRK